MSHELSTTRARARGKGVLLHQLVHGYSEGHRLLDASLKLPDDVARLVLRMSDLSGSSIVQGFEEYVTGYPLASINSYALAKTWYAPEMRRPGCVWTHTLLIPDGALAEISFLGSLLDLFRRPAEEMTRGVYGQAVELDAAKLGAPPCLAPGEPKPQMFDLVWSLYGLPDKSVLISSQSAGDFEDSVFNLWSQQWPTLRKNFGFCTGALSGRGVAGRPFDVQCVPASLVRQVLAESALSPGGEPVLLGSLPYDAAPWIRQAATDAAKQEGGELRSFLWETADDGSRNRFLPLAQIFDLLFLEPSVADLIEAVTKFFPDRASGARLKPKLFGPALVRGSIPIREERDVLAALGSTDHHAAFDAAALHLKDRGKDLCETDPRAAQLLIEDLFRSPINPLGEEVLAGLIAGIGPEIARGVTRDHPRFLPALFRAKPDLAMSPDLWTAAGDRTRELFESLAVHDRLEPGVLHGIIGALLDSGSETFIRRALDRWGKDAVFGALDWVAAHGEKMSETCRGALTFHVPSVMDWVETSPSVSVGALVAVAHIVAPYSYQIAQRDTGAFHRAFQDLKKRSERQEEAYFAAFLLALALGNAPPKPLALVSECFEPVHELVERERLQDDAWLALDPIVPHLWWPNDWDKCERLRRGLLGAFVRHQWPASEIRTCINSKELLRDLARSTYRVDGARHYFRDAL